MKTDLLNALYKLELRRIRASENMNVYRREIFNLNNERMSIIAEIKKRKRGRK
jgi:hypothetical protein